MHGGEVDAVAEALDEAVLAVRPLVGGFSHETCLLTLAGGDRVVVRLGGADPAIEAAVMARGGTRVPDPPGAAARARGRRGRAACHGP